MKTLFQRAALQTAWILLAAIVSPLNVTSVASEAVPSEGELRKLNLNDKPIPLLGDRLRVKMPASSKIEMRGHGIMEPAACNESETRVVLDAKNERFVLMAYELYALYGIDFEKTIRAHVDKNWDKASGTVKIEKLAVTPPLRAIAVVPKLPDEKHEATLLTGLYIGSEDGTVQYLEFHVNPEGAKDSAGAASLARKIAASVSAGPRKLVSKAGDRIFGNDHDGRFVITAPEGFVASTQEGPDFAVFSLVKLSPLGQTKPSLGIYLGGHPSYQYRQAENPPHKVARVPGKLFNQEVEWHLWSKSHEFTAEAITRNPKQRDLSVHVFCTAGTEDELKGLRTTAETIREEDAKK
jgi:hypothetical protein